jgi:hypothetical protein
VKHVACQQHWPLKSVYFAYFHSVMKYGIILWGNSSNSKKTFTLQKKAVRLMAGVKSRNSCRSLFKILEILVLPCEYYIFSMNFIVNKREHLQTLSTQGIRISFKDQLPTSHIFRRVHIMQGSKFSTVYHEVSQVLQIKRHTHTLLLFCRWISNVYK